MPLNWRAHSPVSPDQGTILVVHQGELVAQLPGENEGQYEIQETQDFMLSVKAGVSLSKPIHCLHFYTRGNGDSLRPTRWQLRLAKQAKLTLVEWHLDLSELATNELNAPDASPWKPQTTWHLEAGAQAQHYCLSQFAANAVVDAKAEVHLAKQSQYLATILAKGGQAYREHRLCCLAGEQAQVQIHHLNLALGAAVVNAELDVRHQADHGRSQIVSRALAGQKARSSLSAEIQVDAQAKHNQAQLDNKNLSLSPQAQLYSRPQLAIWNRELLACSHGSTHGHLDEEALFYLRTRGIDINLAKRMLIDAFMAPITNTLPEFLKGWVRQHWVELSPVAVEA